MTAANPTIAEVDDDLDQAIERLQYVVPRYRAVGRLLLDAHGNPERYHEFARLKHERADLRDQIALQSDRLNLKPVDALIRLVEVAVPLTKRQRGGKRKSPTLNAVLAEITEAERYATKAEEEAKVEFVVAKHTVKSAIEAVAELSSARAYLEANRG